MQFCQNPNCSNPFNSEGNRFCTTCGFSNLSPLFKNRYRVTRTLGEGGFGKTYLAEDVDRLDAACVIKQFFPQFQGTAALQKASELFKEEAKRLFELGENHPQIPRLIAYFEQGTNLYLVQEFIAGETLANVMQKRFFNEAEIRKILEDLLPIIQFIHQRNVIHRDIKPENIICRSSDNKMVLIDFGGAKQVTQTTLARQGTGIFTVGYAPLEQIQGYAYPASDLYALGATCVRLLTRVLPTQDMYGNLDDPLYDMHTARWLWRERLAEQGIKISDSLGNILDKLLKHFVAERYQNASEVLQDLHNQSTVPPTVFNADTYNIWGLNKIQNQDFLGAIADFNQALQINSQHIQSLTNRGNAYLELGNYDLALADYEQALKINPHHPEASQGRDKILALKTGNSHKINPKLPANNFTLAYSLPLLINLIRSVVFIPNNQQLICSGNDKIMRIWNLETRKVQNFISETGNMVVVAIAPDGQTLISGSSDKKIRVWNLLTGKIKSILVGHFDLINALSVSPDGKTLVSCSRDRTIKIWQLETGQLQRNFTQQTSLFYTIAISPDGKFLASGSSDKIINIWQLDTGELFRSINGNPGFVRAIAISSVLGILASGGYGNTIHLWNLHNGQLIQRLEGHNSLIQSLIISSDGKTLFSGSDDRTIKIWNLETGALLQTLTGHNASVLTLDISPDGQTLASAGSDRSIKIWQAN
jgi:WD40 repeat protein/tRNA A-37 threonylcarbamoyl transferase component Bud32